MITVYLLNTENITENDLPLFFKDYKSDLKNEQKRISSFIAYEFVKYKACNVLKIGVDKISIKTTQSGKPYIENTNDFHFGISHSDNMVAVAISNAEIGVDIEKMRKVNLKIADRYFTAKEADYVKAVPASSNDRFYEIWTKKEAYIKYHGGSISQLTAIDVTNEQLNKNFYTLKENDFYLSFYSETAEKPKKISLNHLQVLDNIACP